QRKHAKTRRRDSASLAYCPPFARRASSRVLGRINTLMNKSASLSPLDRGLALAALCLLALSGLGLLASELLWNSHGLKAWLLPLGPWSCALLVYRLLRRRQ